MLYAQYKLRDKLYCAQGSGEKIPQQRQFQYELLLPTALAAEHSGNDRAPARFNVDLGTRLPYISAQPTLRIRQTPAS